MLPREPHRAAFKRSSSIHVIKHPDAAGLFRHGEREFVLDERVDP
jgi:hypothetical protein